MRLKVAMFEDQQPRENADNAKKKQHRVEAKKVDQGEKYQGNQIRFL
jgi:hypothetical protein